MGITEMTLMKHIGIGPIPDVIADPDCSPTSPPRHILDCVLLPRISDFLEEEARARSEFLARQKILAQTRPMVIRAILAAASLLDIRPDLMPALGDPLDGLIHIKDSTPTKMDLYAGNIWNMYDMCVVHGLDGELAESIKEAHFTHKHWSLRNSSLMRAGLKYRSLYKQ
jgi:hypothetical protein